MRFRISQESIDSLFHPHSINQIHELGHVVMRDGTLFRNKKNKSITLSGEIHFQAITRLQLYIDQTLEFFSQNLTQKHVLLFPYNSSFSTSWIKFASQNPCNKRIGKILFNRALLSEYSCIEETDSLSEVDGSMLVMLGRLFDKQFTMLRCFSRIVSWVFRKLGAIHFESNLWNPLTFTTGFLLRIT